MPELYFDLKQTHLEILSPEHLGSLLGIFSNLHIEAQVWRFDGWLRRARRRDRLVYLLFQKADREPRREVYHSPDPCSQMLLLLLTCANHGFKLPSAQGPVFAGPTW